METLKLEQNIRTNFAAINHIENLNYGGCLYAAYGVYLKMKNDGLDVSKIKIVQLQTPYSSGIEHNKLYLKGEVKTATSSNHFGLTIDEEVFLDSEGEINMEPFYYHIFIPNSQLETFCVSALTHGDWNNSFNVENGIAEINKVLGINLENYSKKSIELW